MHFTKIILLRKTKTLRYRADHINQLCKNTFLRQLYRKVDGATLMSQNERNLDCEITFQTHSILQRFMLRYTITFHTIYMITVFQSRKVPYAKIHHEDFLCMDL